MISAVHLRLADYLVRLTSYVLRRLCDRGPFKERWQWVAEVVANNHVILESLKMDLDEWRSVKNKPAGKRALKGFEGFSDDKFYH